MGAFPSDGLALLFQRLAEVFDATCAIESCARDALLQARADDAHLSDGPPLPLPFLDVMSRSDAHPICSLIAGLPFAWAPPTTSDDPLYTAHSHFKAHIELLGPDGLVRSDKVRLGLYGILPMSEYGLRTHPAEETFVMLAGRADWMRGDAGYVTARPGERSYHPSMMPHATRTGPDAFMSVYVWRGDISTAGYRYAGLPEAG